MSELTWNDHYAYTKNCHNCFAEIITFSLLLGHLFDCLPILKGNVKKTKLFSAGVEDDGREQPERHTAPTDRRQDYPLCRQGRRRENKLRRILRHCRQHRRAQENGGRRVRCPAAPCARATAHPSTPRVCVCAHTNYTILCSF